MPLEFRPRTTDKSKFNTKETISTLKVATICGIRDKARFIKFGTVGFIGFLVNYFFLRTFRNLNAGEILSWLLPTEIAILSNFTLNNIWTFKTEKIAGVKKIFLKFLQFNLTSAGALVIQSVFGPLGVSLIGVKYDWLVMILVICFMVLPYNYFMYNVFIWRTWKLPKKKG